MKRMLVFALVGLPGIALFVLEPSHRWSLLVAGTAPGYVVMVASRLARWRRQVERDLDLGWRLGDEPPAELTAAERDELVRKFRECWARERSGLFEQGE